MRRWLGARWFAYLLAAILVTAVLAFRLTLVRVDLTVNMPFLLFSLPVLLAAWRGGFGPGLLAAALATGAASLLVINGATDSALDAAVSLGMFFMVGVLVAWLGHARLTAFTRLTEHQAELEHTIQHRTNALSEAVTHLSREVREHQDASDQLREANERLAVSNQELQDFASVASHDLQEPLRKIQAFGDRLGTMYGEELGEQGADYLRRMRSAAGRMQTLINDLLTFSRVTTKAQPFAPTDMNMLATEVLGDLETRIEEKDAKVEVESLPFIEADPLQLRQLLQNLISNALKFAKDDVPPHVRIWADMDEANNALHLHVQDNGIGFDEKYLDRIFHVFQRLHGRTEYEGTGIGLAICRKIAERHQGSLTARSRPGEGATFIVTLPLTQSRGPLAHEPRHQADHHPVG